MRQHYRKPRYSQAEMSILEKGIYTMSAEPSQRMISMIRARLSQVDETQLALLLKLPQGRGEPRFIRATLIEALDALQDKLHGHSETRQEL